MPTCPEQDMVRRNTLAIPQAGDDGMSPEAIIGIIGVVVAMLGIAVSVAWLKRGTLHGRSLRALSAPYGTYIQNYLPSRR
jgi:hypothetical protein